ncbi:hypothetical protein OS188_12885 [Xanthomarina sp. F1114]|uniref:outer membrane beta-barrel protein n=1 Tax=Xanthomarina sp. F1114 TaxID=2996019 RepID=UPI00225DCEDC|nr:outer membrane beta-barrel protein [Xanthomarina sp. F1114]MCX7548848.1 hypothetical protein [Xanthomarina sp. F1114]
MKKLSISIILLFITIFSFGQSRGVNEVLDYPWAIGLGVNIVDNDGSGINQPFDGSNWNFKNPVMLSGEYRVLNYLAINAALSFNSLQMSNLQNELVLPENKSFFAMDMSGKVYLDQFYAPTTRLKRVETYALLGLGFTQVTDFNTGTFNAGVGVQFWFTNTYDLGLRLQTVGKWGFNKSIYLSNYIQHSAEVIYKF